MCYIVVMTTASLCLDLILCHFYNEIGELNNFVFGVVSLYHALNLLVLAK